MVSPASSATGSDVVGSRQSQLPGDRRTRGTRSVGAAFSRDAAQLLQEVARFVAKGTDAAALWISDSTRPGRSGASRPNGGAAHGTAHRSGAGAKRNSFEGRRLSGRNLRGAPRSTLS